MIISFSFGKVAFDVESYLVAAGVENCERHFANTGPRTLFHAREDEDTLTLACEAITELKAKRPTLADDVKILISVTESPQLQFPGNGSALASFANLSNDLLIFDLNAGCTGFVDAVSLAFQYGLPSLIVCSETYSKHNAAMEKSTTSLFADAGAAIYFDPGKYELLTDESTFIGDTAHVICKNDADGLVMKGGQVFQFLRSSVIPMINKALIDHPSVDHIFVHQGSKLVVDAISKKFANDDRTVPSNIVERGNTVSATLPILLKDFEAEASTTVGGTSILVGFGVGLQAHLIVIEKKR